MNSEIEKVTKWVEKVLGKRNFEKIELDFPDYDTGGGYLAEILFVNVKAVRNGKLEKIELLVKKNKESDAALELLNLKSAYELEINIYSKLLPILNKLAEENNCEKFENIPHCYGTISNQNEYVIILENLRSKEFRTHDMKKPQDLNHAKLIIEAYAKWHAFSLALKEGKFRKIFEIFENSSGYLLESKMFGYLIKTMKTEIDSIIRIYKNKNNQKMIEKLELLKEQYPKIYTESMRKNNEDRIVIQHGDSWNNNFLFHYDNEKNPDKAVIIDWQVGLLGAPVIDIINYLFLNCTKNEFIHLDSLLKFYYEIFSNQLRKLGSDPDRHLPWDKFLKSFHRYAPIGIGGLPLAVKMCHKVENGEKYDITQSLDDGNFTKILGNKLEDPEGYFDRINGILEICIERNLF